MSIILRMQNLPWSASSADIRKFFAGVSIPDGGVHIVGGELGDVFIAFTTDEDARRAFGMTNRPLCGTKVTLMLSSKNEMMEVITKSRQAAKKDVFSSAASVPSSQAPPAAAAAVPDQPSTSGYGSSGYGYSESHDTGRQPSTSAPASRPMVADYGYGGNQYGSGGGGGNSQQYGDQRYGDQPYGSRQATEPSAGAGGSNYNQPSASQGYPGRMEQPSASGQPRDPYAAGGEALGGLPAPGRSAEPQEEPRRGERSRWEQDQGGRQDRPHGSRWHNEPYDQGGPRYRDSRQHDDHVRDRSRDRDDSRDRSNVRDHDRDRDRDRDRERDRFSRERSHGYEERLREDRPASRQSSHSSVVQAVDPALEAIKQATSDTASNPDSPLDKNKKAPLLDSPMSAPDSYPPSTKPRTSRFDQADGPYQYSNQESLRWQQNIDRQGPSVGQTAAGTTASDLEHKQNGRGSRWGPPKDPSDPNLGKPSDTPGSGAAQYHMDSNRGQEQSSMRPDDFGGRQPFHQGRMPNEPMEADKYRADQERPPYDQQPQWSRNDRDQDRGPYDMQRGGPQYNRRNERDVPFDRHGDTMRPPFDRPDERESNRSRGLLGDQPHDMPGPSRREPLLGTPDMAAEQPPPARPKSLLDLPDLKPTKDFEKRQEPTGDFDIPPSDRPEDSSSYEGQRNRSSGRPGLLGDQPSDRYSQDREDPFRRRDDDDRYRARDDDFRNDRGDRFPDERSFDYRRDQQEPGYDQRRQGLLMTPEGGRFGEPAAPQGGFDPGRPQKDSPDDDFISMAWPPTDDQEDGNSNGARQPPLLGNAPDMPQGGIDERDRSLERSRFDRDGRSGRFGGLNDRDNGFGASNRRDPFGMDRPNQGPRFGMDRPGPPYEDRFGGPPRDMDRPRDTDRRGPEDVDRRGPSYEMDRRGPNDMNRWGPHDMDRGSSPHDMDRRGPPRDFDRQGRPPHNMDRVDGPPRDMDRRGPQHEMDRWGHPGDRHAEVSRWGPPQDMDRSGLPPHDMDRRGPPPPQDMGRRGSPPRDVDKRGPPPHHVDMHDLPPQIMDGRGPSSDMDRRGQVHNTEGPHGRMPLDADRQGPHDMDRRGPPPHSMESAAGAPPVGLDAQGALPTAAAQVLPGDPVQVLPGGPAPDRDKEQSSADTKEKDHAYIRVTGCHFRVTSHDLVEFFSSVRVNIAPDGIKLVKNNQGLLTGEVFIKLDSKKDSDEAMRKNKTYMGRRFIQVYQCTEEEWQNTGQSSSSPRRRSRSPRSRGRSPPRRGRSPPRSSRNHSPRSRSRGHSPPRSKGSSPGRSSRGYSGRSGRRSRSRSRSPVKDTTTCLELKGLPSDIKEKDITDFFRGVQLVPNSIFIESGEDGKCKGNAYARLANQRDMRVALNRDGRSIGRKKIIVHDISTSVMQAKVGEIQRVARLAALKNKRPDQDSKQSTAQKDAKKPQENQQKASTKENSKPKNEPSQKAPATKPGDSAKKTVPQAASKQEQKPASQMQKPSNQPTSQPKPLIASPPPANPQSATITKGPQQPQQTPRQQQGLLPLPNVPPLAPQEQKQQPQKKEETKPKNETAGTSNDDVNLRSCVHVRNLPYHVTENEVLHFFRDLEIVPPGLVFMLNPDGSPSGQAYMALANQKEAVKAGERRQGLIRGRKCIISLVPKYAMLQAIGMGHTIPNLPNPGPQGQGPPAQESVPPQGQGFQRPPEQGPQRSGMGGPSGDPGARATPPGTPGSSNGSQSRPPPLIQETPGSSNGSQSRPPLIQGTPGNSNGNQSRQPLIQGTPGNSNGNQSRQPLIPESPQSPDGRHPIPLPPLAVLIEQKRILEATNLPFDLPVGGVVELFHKYNVIPDSVRFKNGPGGRPTGAAIAAFVTPQDAHAAIEGVANTLVTGRTGSSRYVKCHHLSLDRL